MVTDGGREGVGVRAKHSSIQEGGVFRRGNFLLWEISCFNLVRNFPQNFQAAVRNDLTSKFSKIACCSITSAKHSSAFVDGIWLDSVR